LLGACDARQNGFVSVTFRSASASLNSRPAWLAEDDKHSSCMAQRKEHAQIQRGFAIRCCREARCRQFIVGS
jgi:hypothetical protein